MELHGHQGSSGHSQHPGVWPSLSRKMKWSKEREQREQAASLTRWGCSSFTNMNSEGCEWSVHDLTALSLWSGISILCFHHPKWPYLNPEQCFQDYFRVPNLPFSAKKTLLQEILHASTWAEIIVLESSRKLYGT